MHRLLPFALLLALKDSNPDSGDFELAGDPQTAFPAAERTFRLRWSGAGGVEPLRGVIGWSDGARPLGASVVEVNPGT